MFLFVLDTFIFLCYNKQTEGVDVMAEKNGVKNPGTEPVVMVANIVKD